MNLFVCSTAYQLMNAVYLAKSKDEKSDIIFIKRGMEKICDIYKLKKEKLFRNIYCWYTLTDKVSDDNVADSKSKIIYNLKKLYIYNNLKKIYKTLPNYDQIYETIYIGYADFPSQCIYYYFEKNDCKLNLYEDGTYTYECLAVEPSLLRRISCHILFGSYILDKCSKIWIRKIEQLNLGKHTDIEIGIIEVEEKMKSRLLSIFRGDGINISAFSKSTIFFDQNIEINLIKGKQIEIVETIVKEIGKDELVVKMHPASKNINYPDNVLKFYDRLPFELIMDSYSMDNKILISIFSTACFSPKLLMDEEPYIILTYRIMKNWFSINSQYLELIGQVKDSYKKPEKIMIPDSIEELTKDILRIRSLERDKNEDNICSSIYI